MSAYREFLEQKVRIAPSVGFRSTALPKQLKAFQHDITEWALRRGRAALFEGTGLGKTVQQLSWARAVQAETHKPVCILAPLAVAEQTVAEAGKFDIDGVSYAADGAEAKSPIVVTNYSDMAGGMSSSEVIDTASGRDWTLYHGDCIDVARGLPDNSLHYSIYSPPFQSLYTFSDDPRDLSNCADDATFWTHYRFLIAEMARALMPGRMVSIHCMQLPTSKLRDGFIGLRDFRGQIIAAHEEAGLLYHSEVLIRKDPVAAMQRTKAIGLLHKQIVKDSALSRMAVADYIVTMRKPGDNPEPVAGAFMEYFGSDPAMPAEDPGHGASHIASSYSVKVWQRYAESVWMDINQSDVLSRTAARAEADERHISPLQLTPIRRCIQLWTMPGDVVFSPFAGIGSELYVAIQQGRRALGAELKASYYHQAVTNLRQAESSLGRRDLFDTDAAA